MSNENQNTSSGELVLPMAWLNATEDQFQQLRFHLYEQNRNIFLDEDSAYHELDQMVMMIRWFKLRLGDGANPFDLLAQQSKILALLPRFLNLYAENGGKFYDFEGQLVTT